MRKILVDLGAIVQNYQLLKQEFAPAKVMAVVKADAYGHGMLEVAKALDSNGVDALGVADFDEAIVLRESGIRSRVMCWLLASDTDFAKAAELDIELGISTFDQLDRVLAGNKLHVKIDTGLGRNGFSPLDWAQLFQRLSGSQNVVGVLSHLANTSEVEDRLQAARFQAAIDIASQYGVVFQERHLTATAGSISYPEFRFDMVRCGIGIYGLNPFEDQDLRLPLRPAMRATAELINVKPVAAGQGVSYGYRYVTGRETHLGLVPFGYGEGMPRISLGHQVLISGTRYPVVGRVAMDQFVVDLGDNDLPLGSEVVIFGEPAKGEPSAEQLGATAGTINYEIVTRIGGRASRVYLDR